MHTYDNKGRYIGLKTRGTAKVGHFKDSPLDYVLSVPAEGATDWELKVDNRVFFYDNNLRARETSRVEGKAHKMYLTFPKKEEAPKPPPERCLVSKILRRAIGMHKLAELRAKVRG